MTALYCHAIPGNFCYLIGAVALSPLPNGSGGSATAPHPELLRTRSCCGILSERGKKHPSSRDTADCDSADTDGASAPGASATRASAPRAGSSGTAQVDDSGRLPAPPSGAIPRVTAPASAGVAPDVMFSEEAENNLVTLSPDGAVAPPHCQMVEIGRITAP